MLKKWLAILIVGIMLAMAQEVRVSMDFQGTDMPLFLQWFGKQTNKKIIYQQQGLHGKKIYFICPQGIPEKSIETIGMAILESNGFTLIRSGEGEANVYKLVEMAEEELRKMEEGDYYISQLIIIKHLQVSSVVTALKQTKVLHARAGSVVEIKGANALIIQDFVPNIRRAIKIIEMIDKPQSKMEIAFVSLKNAQASDINEKLQRLFQANAKERAEYNLPEPLTIVADSRTNSLILKGSREEIQEARNLIERLDREIKEEVETAKIYELKYVTPEKIVPALKEFIKTSVFLKKAEKQIAAGPSLDRITVITNEHTKSLLITATEKEHKLLESVIQKFDVRRPQVLLETVICEFSPSDVLNIGIELLGTGNTEGVDIHGLTSFGLSSIVDSAGKAIDDKNPAFPAGRKLAPGTGLTTFITKGNESKIPFLLKTIQSQSNAEVLSTPRVLTDDGEKAEIRVQQEVPVTSTNALNSSTSTTSFKEFVSAGTVLIIKPQIIHSNWLRLEITQDIEAFIGNAPSLGVPPPKSSRSLKTVVTVPNGQMVILGGLYDRREVETIDKIPILGDIPILGMLFQTRTRSVSKTNLYIFIWPKILIDPEFKDLYKISQEEHKKAKKASKDSLEKME
ncbi:MAG: hypothetical protein HUU50_22540 [Candidatus Brocadiae bacterium]|nr:hypothetical protein [Candidatus Brocadiia bacterium]